MVSGTNTLREYVTALPCPSWRRFDASAISSASAGPRADSSAATSSTDRDLPELARASARDRRRSGAASMLGERITGASPVAPRRSRRLRLAVPPPQTAPDGRPRDALHEERRRAHRLPGVRRRRPGPRVRRRVLELDRGDVGTAGLQPLPRAPRIVRARDLPGPTRHRVLGPGLAVGHAYPGGVAR